MRSVFLCLMGLGFVLQANAQATLPDHYYINQAKKEVRSGLKEEILKELAEKDVSALVIGTKDGILSYMIADGVRTEFNTNLSADLSESEKAGFYWHPPYLVPVPPIPKTPENKNDFAELLQRLYQNRWRVKHLSTLENKEVYFFER